MLQQIQEQIDNTTQNVKTKKEEYKLSSKENVNKTKYEQIVEEYGSFDEYVNKTNIFVKQKQRCSIY